MNPLENNILWKLILLGFIWILSSILWESSNKRSICRIFCIVSFVWSLKNNLCKILNNNNTVASTSCYQDIMVTSFNFRSCQWSSSILKSVRMHPVIPNWHIVHRNRYANVEADLQVKLDCRMYKVWPIFWSFSLALLVCRISLQVCTRSWSPVPQLRGFAIDPLKPHYLLILKELTATLCI